MVADLHRMCQVDFCWVMLLIQIPHLHWHDRFILREPMTDLITEQLKTQSGIICKCCDSLAIEPAAFFLQCHRHIKMIQVDEGLDAMIDQSGEVLAIKCHRLLIDRPSSFWQQATPLDRGSKRIKTDLFHQRHIFWVTLQQLDGIFGSPFLIKTFWLRCVPIVPNRIAFAIIGHSSFSLWTAGGGPPPKIFRKMQVSHGQSPALCLTRDSR